MRKAYVVGGLNYPWVRDVRAKTRAWATWLEWPSLYPEQIEQGALVFFVHWSGRVPKEFTDSRVCVNFHCTPLPYGRGGHPIENLLIRGHRSTVMTAHLMDGGLDTGPILDTQERISLYGSRENILSRFTLPVAEMMLDITMRDSLEGRPQEGEPVIFSRLTEWELTEVWSRNTGFITCDPNH